MKFLTLKSPKTVNRFKVKYIQSKMKIILFYKNKIKSYKNKIFKILSVKIYKNKIKLQKIKMTGLQKITKIYLIFRNKKD